MGRNEKRQTDSNKIKNLKRETNRKKITIRKGFIAIAVILAVFVLGAVSFAVYVNLDYPASEEVQQLLNDSNNISFHSEENAYIVEPEGEREVGILFYPGAKVEETAYLPLLELLSEEGYYCVCVKMPFQMAVFGVNAADKIIAMHPEISQWYLMGHSLGGAMAASYAGDHEEQLEGLIFLAAYAANDLSSTELRVLSLYGSKDEVLNREKLEQNRNNLPGNFQELVIEGGNHAWFGYYGEQKGDGIAQITRQEQQDQTKDAIVAFIQKGEQEH